MSQLIQCVFSKAMTSIKAFRYSAVASLMLCFGCSEKRTLYVYNWSDYIDEELVAQFERENECSVVIDAFDDNETMLAKLMAGATGYDVIFPSSYMIETLVNHGLIGSLDTNLLPNVVANIDHKYDKVFHDRVLTFSVPYAFSVTGIAYRSDKYRPTDAELSWDLLVNPAFENRVSLLNDIREMLGIGLKKNGNSVNSKNENELSDAVAYIKKLKNRAKKLDNVQYRISLVNGEFYVAVGYVCDILQVKNENPCSPISFFVPKEGSTCCWDEMAVTSGANRELAHKFIDFLYRPDVAAKNVSYVCAPMPNDGMMAVVGDAVREDPWINIREDVLSKLELVLDVGEAMPMYTKAWDEFISFKKDGNR